MRLSFLAVVCSEEKEWAREMGQNQEVGDCKVLVVHMGGTWGRGRTMVDRDGLWRGPET